MSVTPQLPRRERLDSFSRLLRRKGLALSPRSPKRFLQPPSSPLQPRLPTSPIQLQLSPRVESPGGSPLYSPDQQRTFLGRGSFGQVALAHYKGRALAVKLESASSWSGERLLVGVPRHPHLVRVYHVSEPVDGARLVLMEFAGHCNLQQLLEAAPIQWPRRLRFCAQVAAGLSHLHAHGLVHADLKPANVVVSSRGTCKLADFGLSRREGEPGAPGGTPAYAAPEVLRGGAPSRPSDLFSLGVSLWQVHSREPPFAGHHPHVVIYKVASSDARPRFPAGLGGTEARFAELAERCWRTLADQRPTAQQALACLQELVPH